MKAADPLILGILLWESRIASSYLVMALGQILYCNNTYYSTGLKRLFSQLGRHYFVAG